MSTPYQQDKRIGELITPLGRDKLVLVEFVGTEAISSLFEFDITALCEQEPDQQLNFDRALGQTCTVRATTFAHQDRYFSGTLVETARLGAGAEGVYYSLKLRPWFWLATQRINSRVFNNKTLEQIIRTVLGDYPSSELVANIQAAQPIEYCVQHRESDFAFVSRLLEQYGLAYYFKHDQDRQTMMIASSRSDFEAAPGTSRAFYPRESGPFEGEFLWSWVGERHFKTGKVTLNDYDFMQPNANLIAEREGGAAYKPANLEAYGHPGGYTKPDLAQDFAKAQINSIQAADKRLQAEGNCLGLSPGMTVTLEKHPEAGEHLVLNARHHLTSESYRSDSDTVQEPYVGNYELMSADVPYAPPQVTPRPFISGPQTGVVTDDRDADPEGYGRIKVHFHWNVGSGRDEAATMWCRVAEAWAGSEWGTQFIPRIGMEVLVQFIDGNPDRPVVVGAVYNAHNRAPFEFRHTSGMRSEATNELSFVDKPSDELVYIFGKKDLKATVKNDVLVEADNTITLRVGRSEIVMDSRSITMTSDSIKIEATTDLKTNSKATANHEAGGPMIIKAAIVKIN